MNIHFMLPLFWGVYILLRDHLLTQHKNTGSVVVFPRSGSPRSDHMTSRNDTERFDSIRKSGPIMSYAELFPWKAPMKSWRDHIEGNGSNSNMKCLQDKNLVWSEAETCTKQQTGFAARGRRTQHNSLSTT